MSVPDLIDYKRFFDETPVALIRTDLNTGKFLMANKFAVALFGYDSFDDLRSSAKITDFYPEESREKLIQTIRQKGLVEGYEIKLVMPKGKTIWVSARLRINCGGDCIEGSLIDITHYAEIRDKYLSSMKEVGKKLDKRIAAMK